MCLFNAPREWVSFACIDEYWRAFTPVVISSATMSCWCVNKYYTSFIEVPVIRCARKFVTSTCDTFLLFFLWKKGFIGAYACYFSTSIINIYSNYLWFNLQKEFWIVSEHQTAYKLTHLCNKPFKKEQLNMLRIILFTLHHTTSTSSASFIKLSWFLFFIGHQLFPSVY